MEQKKVKDELPSQNNTITKEEAQRFAEAEFDKNLPGKGYMFGISDRYLPESSRLNLKEALSLAIADTQQYAFDRIKLPSEEQMSLFDYFRNRLLRYRISCGGEDWGEGRKENILMHQIHQDEKEKIRGSVLP